MHQTQLLKDTIRSKDQQRRLITILTIQVLHQNSMHRPDYQNGSQHQFQLDRKGQPDSCSEK